MNITKEELPMQQFERLGMTEERLQRFSKDEMNAMLSGFPSNMKFLNFKDNQGNACKINARLSVYRTADGTIGLKVHPYRKKIKNDRELTKKEIERLHAGESITRTYNKQEYLVQLDQSINELRRIRTDHIKIAEAAGSSRLTGRQKTDFLSGKSIVLKDEYGRKIPVSLDLTRPAGIRMQHQIKEVKRNITSGPHENQHNVEQRQQEHIRMKR